MPRLRRTDRGARAAGNGGQPVARADGSSAADSGFAVETSHGSWLARNVVLANGAYQRPRMPASSANLPNHIRQLHSHDYRNPAQLPDGAVLVLGTGQSGGQITEDLLDAGREVHLSVSACPEADTALPRPGRLLLAPAGQPARTGPRHQRPAGRPAPLPRRLVPAQSADLRQQRRPQHQPAGSGPPRRPADRPLRGNGRRRTPLQRRPPRPSRTGGGDVRATDEGDA
ncbi:NAD(P)-binding domain-containing protein [Pseudarthrobacter sp. MM222]|uniref:NAD(P)-binding domain-containing protein n=1 Tax=Pseudarthrobacter sp. MM222 TaxID=3018929 RepID=UPI002FD4E626